MCAGTGKLSSEAPTPVDRQGDLHLPRVNRARKAERKPTIIRKRRRRWTPGAKAVIVMFIVIAAVLAVIHFFGNEASIGDAATLFLGVFLVLFAGFVVLRLLGYAFRGVWLGLRFVGRRVGPKLRFLADAAFNLALIAGVVPGVLLGLDWYFELDIAPGKGWIPVTVWACLGLGWGVLAGLARLYERHSELREPKRMGSFPGEPALRSGGAGVAVGCAEAALEGIRKEETVSAPVPVSVVGAEPTEEHNDGWTPLHRAAILGDYSQIVNSLEGGADPNEAGLDPLLLIPFDSVMAEDYNTALETLAEIWGYDMAEEIILEAGRPYINSTASRNSLDETVVWGPGDGVTTAPEESDVDFIARLIRFGADPNKQGPDGLRPMHVAAQIGRAEVISVLHSGGADLDARNTIGQTAMHIAAEKGHAGAVRTLLSAGAEPNARMRNGATPLHSAALSGQSEVITILKMGGAEPNVRRSDGATPLHLSAQYGHAGAVHRLLDAGADPGVRHNGKTPLDTWKGEKNDAYWRLNDLTER